MKIEKEKRYQNAFTGAKVTVTNIENGIVSYTKDKATEMQMTRSSEYVNSGHRDNVKPEYVFKKSYVEIK